MCTPGRLVDHITATDGLSLKHLRFLVIDEADRLLGQAYHNWLEKIFHAVYEESESGFLMKRFQSSIYIFSNIFLHTGKFFVASFMSNFAERRQDTEFSQRKLIFHEMSLVALLINNFFVMSP